ncbi:MAG: DUF4391 domain-containing protein [Methylovulum sp.]|nr:DUF4391 domain-containing protein [Methylovulum sp.]
MSHALFHYPNAATLGRKLPKNKIYEHAKPSTAVRELFVSQVDKIIWQYKLAPETINLPAKPNVPEIQIFTLALKTPELSEDVLRCIDQAIPFPIIYQLTVDDRIKVKAAYKRPHDTDSTKWLVDRYFETDWQANTTERSELPLVIDLAGLYEHLLRQLIPLPAKTGETLNAQLERIGMILRKQQEYQKLDAKVQKEKQFNRKVELNKQLRILKQHLEQLH